MEIIGASIRGIYRDVLKGENNSIIFDSGWVPNTIVDGCRKLLAAYMKNDPSQGIQYLAVGQGKESWDEEDEGPPNPGPEITKLENQYDPPVWISDQEHFNIVYLDENEAEAAGPTTRLQVTVTLEPGYPKPLQPLGTFPLREFGLFGTFNGNDYMIDCIRHPVIHKDKQTTLLRVVRLSF